MPLKSASYLDFHVEIDNGGRSKTELVDKRDSFTFPIVNFPFITSNIPAVPAYGVYISELKLFQGYMYCDFLDRGQLLSEKC